MNFTDEINDGQARETNRRYYRTEIPNIVDDLGLSPITLRLYVHIKRVAGANSEGRCYQGARKLKTACNMSIGSVTNAKKELLRPRPELGGKSLIRYEGKFDTIVDGKKKATDCFSVVDIWNENLAHFQNRKAGRSYNEHHAPIEQGMFTDDVHLECSSDCSPDELKNKPFKNEPYNEITQREEEQPHSHNSSNVEGSEEVVIDRSNTTEIDSPTDYVIEGVPVFDDEPLAVASGVAEFPKESCLTEEMRAWARENISSEIDVELGTRKFFAYYDNETKRLTFENWKLWMLRERPDYSGGAGRYMTPSERRTEALKSEERKDLFADFDENESFSDSFNRIISNYEPRNDGRPLTASEKRMEALKRLHETDLFAHIKD